MLNPVNLPAYRGALKQVNLALYQGDSWSATITVLNPDSTPADLTGAVANAQIRTGPADQSWEVAAEIATVIVDNVVALALSPGQTTLLTDQPYYWDLEIVGAGGLTTTTLMAGQVAVTLEVTREVPVVTVPLLEVLLVPLWGRPLLIPLNPFGG